MVSELKRGWKHALPRTYLWPKKFCGNTDWNEFQWNRHFPVHYFKIILGVTIFTILFCGSADPIFFQKRKEKEYYFSRNYFFLLVPDRYLMASGLGYDAYRSCLRLNQTRHSKRHSSAYSPGLRLTIQTVNPIKQADYRAWGINLFYFFIFFFVYTLSSSRVCLYFPALIKGRTDALIALGWFLHCT